MAINTDNFNFDPDQLRDKYRQERDKRLRADGNDQYKEVEGDFKYFVEDPYTEKVDKNSESLITEVAIIGGGFGGILAASRLRMSGFHYKNQIWVGGPETMICIGIYGQAIYIDQKNKVVIVKLSSHPEPDDPLILGNTFLGIAALSENL